MPIKREVLKIIDEDNRTSFNKAQCKGFVTSVKRGGDAPSRLKKGDVYGWDGGAKVRPCVIIKVMKHVSYGIPLTTTLDEMVLMRSNSRFFGNSYYSRAIECAKNDYIFDNFIGVHDNPKELNKAIKLIMDEFNNNIL